MIGPNDAHAEHLKPALQGTRVYATRYSCSCERLRLIADFFFLDNL